MGNCPIIVEGPDGSGKTTLAHKLSDVFGLEYRRPAVVDLDSSTGPRGMGLVDWWDRELARSSSQLALGVYDRCFYISDPIYQAVQVNRDLLVNPGYLVRGIARLWNIEPILVFCLPPFDVQLSNVRFDNRPRLAGVDDKGLEKVNNLYHAFYAMWTNGLFDNVFRFDYTTQTFDDLQLWIDQLGVKA